MLKSIFSGLGKVFIPKISFKRLLGTRELKGTAQLARDMAKDAFTQDEAARKETFAEAARRFKLSGTDVDQRHRRFLQMAGLFLLASLLCFAYSIYLAFQGGIMAFILGFAVSCLGLAYAFRYHFWAFQLKNKKLGCTLQEWWNSEIKTSKQKTVAAPKGAKSVMKNENKESKKQE